MEYMCFNQRGDISTLNSSSLKLVDKFTYLGSSVSSTETYINTRLAKAWTASDSLSVIWKSDLTDKVKRSFFQVSIRPLLERKCVLFYRSGLTSIWLTVNRSLSIHLQVTCWCMSRLMRHCFLGYDIRSIFKRSLTGLNLEFSFS